MVCKANVDSPTLAVVPAPRGERPVLADALVC